MRFVSTRGEAPPVSFSTAVAQGLAPDGGLYLPEELPDLQPFLSKWQKLSYPDLCLAFFGLFADDLEQSTLSRLVEASYKDFADSEIAPISHLAEKLSVLELFHGPTLAFKDFALQLLGNLYEEQISRTGQPLSVLGATSGDTGAAAISGLLGKEGVKVFILYPDGRVSSFQERQMTCTGADNVFPLAIDGTFDDAQAALKEVFNDHGFKERVGLSAVNSINLARILAQSVYYLSAWLRLPAGSREETVFVVPTGNFGNVFAGWLLSQMGVPISEFRVATNQNDVLHRLFQTGEYALGPVSPSFAPSMDIQVASNFERFLYYFVEGDSNQVRRFTLNFRQTGSVQFEGFSNLGFSSSRVSDSEIPEIIKSIYDKYGYLVDPHTACSFKNLDPTKPHLVLATAHPAKFPTVFQLAGLPEPRALSLEILQEKEIVKYSVEPTKESIKNFILDNVG
tara:strand:+ start:892 stop:2250 length:1359 start_codon:yes stop_codon:yes gene_type:complete